MSKIDSVKLIIRNLEQLVQVCAKGELVKKGVQQDELAVLTRRSSGTGCCIVVDRSGRICDVGFDEEVLPKYEEAQVTIDGQGCSLIPGLIDSHTHPVWAGDRCFEFDLKMKGATYLDIHKSGGGIYYTVRETQKASLDQLAEGYRSRLKSMLGCGTTLVESKSGYGLDFETELKILRVIETVRSENPIVESVITFLGAHAIPEFVFHHPHFRTQPIIFDVPFSQLDRGLTAEQGVNDVLSTMTRLSEEVPQIKIDFVDVFCEKGVYNVSQSRQILTAGRAILGADISFHGDELSPLGAGELAKELGARAVSHLEFITPTGVQAMAESGTAAILCPTTAYLLKLQAPPARYMIKKEVPVVIATDFNPNAYCYSLPMAMNLAVVNFGLTLNESLTATTINAAYALSKSSDYGSLERGKLGDMILLNCHDWRHLIYRFGDTRELIRTVIKKGTIVK